MSSRSPYGEPTVPLRIPRSLLPSIQAMLADARRRAQLSNRHQAAIASMPTVKRTPRQASARSN